MKLESDLQSLWWKIKWEDVVIGNRATSRSGSRFSNIQVYLFVRLHLQ